MPDLENVFKYSTGINPNYQQMELYGNEHFVYSKGNSGQNQEQRSLLATPSDNGLISRIYKELQKLNTKETKLPVIKKYKWAGHGGTRL